LDFAGTTAKIRVRCSKGTYIRTLCKDIGEALGCGGCMAQLRRVSAGEYAIENAVPLANLVASDNPGKYLLPVDSMFAQYEAVALTSNQEKRCRNGGAFSIQLPDGTYRVYGQNQEFLALTKAESGIMSTIKSFFDV
jgi:tRNA pseudouridine55 synthase